MFGDLGAAIQEFQSTLSVRRATSLDNVFKPVDVFQSTLSVRRATVTTNGSPRLTLFQSTLSVRRATADDGKADHADHISIHALREESD